MRLCASTAPLGHDQRGKRRVNARTSAAPRSAAPRSACTSHRGCRGSRAVAGTEGWTAGGKATRPAACGRQRRLRELSTPTVGTRRRRRARTRRGSTPPSGLRIARVWVARRGTGASRSGRDSVRHDDARRGAAADVMLELGELVVERCRRGHSESSRGERELVRAMCERRHRTRASRAQPRNARQAAASASVACLARDRPPCEPSDVASIPWASRSSSVCA